MAEERKGTDGDVQVNVNGEQLTELDNEQVKQLLNSITSNLERTMETMNKTLATVLSDINVNGSLPQTNLFNMMHQLPNQLANIDPVKWKEKLPSLEAANDEGKIQLLLNKKKIVEFDLSNLMNDE
ncbi:hypothetical protein [Heyndrickxia oleronia]|uniref:Uncharacterized protein n=1 Tax=Heyndrickxia oleronia TaxID=38875 RepID=A0A8E2LE05_9BACI|nr:hypothetical protein [Heyndrickxia oleronia]OJH17680.1 hypothetical protein BLX88_17685 [Bacillus obstructivus]MDH5160920.1 hypothetical protein [Heyndrickxia oleronia]MEC1372884.1 hypothetical protein [Heyndrickxia oleronia]OOP68620.1 hypothetical protein BWZ43_09580 [Heyndrickxia oleronia]QQZ03479.1 hypothetical protein I5818_17170 [Heyndrickxia oleronia]